MMKWLIFFIIGVLLLWLFGTIAHEQVHVEIFKSYGIKSNISYSLLGAMTMPETSCNDNNCILAHNINEVVGYQMLGVYAFLLFGFTFVIMAIEHKKK